MEEDALHVPGGAPGLRAILLITEAKPGGRLVFHYPRNPLPINAAPFTDIPKSMLHAFKKAYDEAKPASSFDPDGASPESGGQAATPVVNPRTAPESSILGVSAESLEKVLAPGRWCDRQRFEMCMDGLTYIGHPVYAARDGSWPRKAVDTSSDADDVDPVGAPGDQHLDVTITEPTSLSPPQDFTHAPESLEPYGGTSLGTSVDSTTSTSAMPMEKLTMFHVVFVVAPPEHQENGDQMLSDVYRHVARALSQALLHCQGTANYVGTESRKLTAMKAKAKTEKLAPEPLWEQMLQTSELAWAMQELFEGLSADKVTGIRVNGIPMSLQIPPRDRPSNTDADLDPNMALLLLEDKEELLRELAQADASPLVYFIREHTTGKSLSKHARNLDMDLSDILFLARHLIKWRKARPIQPTHPRNFYVLAPTAPLHRIPALTPDYARRFEALPSLRQMLKLLGRKPIRYGMLMPSREHRTPFTDILAYLLRQGFVVQLKTFGWLTAGFPSTPSTPAVRELANRNRRPLAVASLLSPQLRPVEEDAISVSSEQTAFLAARTPQNGHTPAASEDKEREEGVGLILDPAAPSDDERKRMKDIQIALQNDELRSSFDAFAHLLDGEHALEELSSNAGLKRSRAEACLDALQKAGHLSTFRCIDDARH